MYEMSMLTTHKKRYALIALIVYMLRCEISQSIYLLVP